MAVQGNVFENGQWVTRTLDPRELLGPTTSTPRSRLQPPEPPSYGILTKTVIASPVIRWVLPVQLRSSRNNDVAFIGVCFGPYARVIPSDPLGPIWLLASSSCKCREGPASGTQVALPQRPHQGSPHRGAFPRGWYSWICADAVCRIASFRYASWDGRINCKM